MRVFLGRLLCWVCVLSSGILGLDVRGTGVFGQHLTESPNFLIIQSQADFDTRRTEIQAKLFPENQGNDNPLPTLIPTTVAFLPSKDPYNIGTLKLGYLTALLGLGASPDDVILAGDILVHEGIQATTNVFYKSLQNLRISGDLQWPTSQACPLR